MLKQHSLLQTLILVLGLFVLGTQAAAQSDAQSTWLENKGYNTRILTPQNDDLYPVSQEQYTLRQKEQNNRPTPPYQTPPMRSAPEEIPFPPPPSAIEQMYSGRVISALPQFGYDMFGLPDSYAKNKASELMPTGAVQDDFILSSGDELQITFTGQRTDTDTYKINSQGMLLIKDFAPIPAAGREITQLQKSIEAAAANLHNTQVYVSLSSVRQIGVLVIGHVHKPGTRTLSVFHTVLDALMSSGGIKKDGSLRQIKLVRAGRSQTIDLYDLLVDTSAHSDLRLRNGDRIIVPPIGPTVAISGAVNRPGIYEIRSPLKGQNEKLNLNAMLDLAGGVLAPGQNRFMKLELTKDGHENVSEITKFSASQFGNGAILSVIKGKEQRAGTIELTGHTRRPGLHDLYQNNTLGKLLDTEQALGPDIYPLIGVIERTDHDLMARKFLAFPVRLVLKGQYDQKLEDGDTIHLFSNHDITALQNHGKQSEKLSPVALTQTMAPKSIEEPPTPEILSFLREHAVFVRGAMRSPGLYPVANGETLDSLLAAAGGLTLDADPTNIEITTALREQGRGGTLRQNIDLHETNPAIIEIKAGDTIRANQKSRRIEDKTALITGEIMHPGRFDLLPGDKVSDLINRAGGTTQQAYPPGSIFSRESERKAEEMHFRATAQEMERALAAAIQSDKDPPSAAQIEMVRGLAAELATVEAAGRITVETDPAVLSVEPELDMLLEAGDRIYIPKRPLTVRVSGEVLSPASLQFRQSKDPLEYIHQAGGFTYHADKDRTFVLYPDGSAQPLQVSSWNHNPIFIPPGSTIIVPRDPKPFDFIQSARDVSQILSNLAITSIFIDDLRD